MKAVWYDRQGAAAEVLTFGELPTPEPGAGEVRVRLHASAVNPADANRRSGRRHPMEFARIIPNSDGAGVIDKVGTGVEASRVGERVWLCFGQRGRAWGTAAESICVPQDLVSTLPDRLGLEQGACLGIPCMTAWCALFADSTPAGQRVLVTGGAGAVGHYAIQLAKWAGAFVVATVRSPARAEHAWRAGADAVIDCTRDGAIQAVAGHGIDRIVDVDAVANTELVLQCAADGAAWVSYAVGPQVLASLPMDRLIRKNIALRGLYMPGVSTTVRRAAQRGVNDWLDDVPDALHTVDSIYALRDTALAHAAVERGGKQGTVIVRCDSEAGRDSGRDTQPTDRR